MKLNRSRKVRRSGTPQPCSAELHSAVSQICNLLTARRFGACRDFGRAADCKSAIQQIENLRYAFEG